MFLKFLQEFNVFKLHYIKIFIESLLNACERVIIFQIQTFHQQQILRNKIYGNSYDRSNSFQDVAFVTLYTNSD